MCSKGVFLVYQNYQSLLDYSEARCADRVVQPQDLRRAVCPQRHCPAWSSSKPQSAESMISEEVSPHL